MIFLLLKLSYTQWLFFRPREQSSKLKVPMLRDVVTVKKKLIRDPRFDESCGTFNAKVNKRVYL